MNIWRFKRSDVAFVLGLAAFIGEVASSGQTDRTVIIASIGLMGFPLFTRIDDTVRKNGNGK